MKTCDLERVRRELKRWGVRQCIIYGVAAYIAAVAFIHPPFGMGKSNYLLQALVALAAAIVGLVTSVRASLLVQQILAASAGSTLSYRLGQSVGQLMRCPYRRGESGNQTLTAMLFTAVRAGSVAAVVWCVCMLATAYYVWTPGKGRPGTYFARDVFPIVLAVSFALFILGAIWTAASNRAYDSRAVKWSVCIAFAVAVLAQWFSLTGR